MARLFLLAFLSLLFSTVTASRTAPGFPLAPKPSSTPYPTPPRLVDDFYTAANFNWLRTAVAPSNTFQELHNKTDARLFELVKRAAHKVKNGTAELSHEERILGNWFISGLDLHARNALGLGPLADIFADIHAVNHTARLAGSLARKGIDVFFGVSLYPVVNNSGGQDTSLIMTPGINLLGWNNDSVVKACENATNAYAEQACIDLLARITQVFQKMGDTHEIAEVNAKHVIEAVSALLFNGSSSASIGNITAIPEGHPGFDIHVYFKELGVPLEWVTCWGLDWFQNFYSWTITASAEQLNAFFRWRVLSRTQFYLPEDISELFYNFADGASYPGALKLEREVFALIKQQPAINNILGQAFSQKLLPPKTYKLVETFVETIRKTFRRRIQGLGWMEESTKAEALLKIDGFRVLIGAPSNNSEGLKISQDSYLDNALRTLAYYRTLQLSFIGAPYSQTVRTFWLSPPQKVNAFYYSSSNTIFLHAGILQPPFFDPEASDEINFGAIGAVIGHEMGHGFDNNGRNYDHEGIGRDWWTANDDQDYEKITSALISQFNSYTYFGVPVNGTLKLGENIADLGGLQVSFDAWNATRLAGGLPLAGYASEKFVPPEWKDFSPAQRFFLSFTKLFRALDTKDEGLDDLKNAAHSPAIFRVNGPFSNLDAFYNAFNVQKGDKMYREPTERIRVW